MSSSEMGSMRSIGSIGEEEEAVRGDDRVGGVRGLAFFGIVFAGEGAFFLVAWGFGLFPFPFPFFVPFPRPMVKAAKQRERKRENYLKWRNYVEDLKGVVLRSYFSTASYKRFC
jgi:hypothetical protein